MIGPLDLRTATRNNSSARRSVPGVMSHCSMSAATACLLNAHVLCTRAAIVAGEDEPRTCARHARNAVMGPSFARLAAGMWQRLCRFPAAPWRERGTQHAVLPRSQPKTSSGRPVHTTRCLLDCC